MNPSPGDDASGPSESAPIRQARLKPQFADDYPEVEPDTWVPVESLVQDLLAALRRSRPNPVREVRLLDNTHFEFRGGPGHEGRRGGRRMSDRF